LAKTNKTRQKRYLALFDTELSDYSLEEIRSSVNRAWMLGSKKFKKQVGKMIGRRVEPTQRGGDRKSEKFKMLNQLHLYLTSSVFLNYKMALFNDGWMRGRNIVSTLEC